jgi:hypothetical protein
MEPQKFFFGATSHLGNYPMTPEQHAEMLSGVGMNAYRTAMYWNNTEYPSGTFPLLGKNGIYTQLDEVIRDSAAPTPFIVLGYNNGYTNPPAVSSSGIAAFSNYAQVVAARYADRDEIFWEVWNEYNVGFGMGGAFPWKDALSQNTPADYPTLPATYLQLYVPTREAIKAVAPSAHILPSGSIRTDPSWWISFIQQGGYEYIAEEGINIHPYYTGEGDVGYLPFTPNAEGNFGYMDSVQSALRSAAAAYLGVDSSTVPPIPVWITELGISNFSGGGQYTGPDGRKKVASELVKSALLFRTLPYVRGLFVYSLVDNNPVDYDANGNETGTCGADYESNFGIHRRPDFMPKTAAVCFSGVGEHIVRGHDFSLSVTDGNWAVLWTKDGQQHTAAWQYGETNISIDGESLLS